MSEPPPPPTEPAEPPPRAGRLAFGLVLVAMGAAWLLEVLGVAVPWEVVSPATLIAVGVILVVGSRSGAAPAGLIPAGIVLTVLLLFGTAVDVPLGGGVGDRSVRPGGLAEIGDGVELGIGRLTLDLSELHLVTSGEDRLRARVGIGELVVIVPEGLAVIVEARASLGSVRVFGEQEGGVDAEITVASSVPGSLTLEATVGIGEVRVEHG